MVVAVDGVWGPKLLNEKFPGVWSVYTSNAIPNPQYYATWSYITVSLCLPTQCFRLRRRTVGSYLRISHLEKCTQYIYDTVNYNHMIIRNLSHRDYRMVNNFYFRVILIIHYIPFHFHIQDLFERKCFRKRRICTQNEFTIIIVVFHHAIHSIFGHLSTEQVFDCGGGWKPLKSCWLL